MKKTIIALLALAGVANADWFNVTGTTGDDIFANDGTNYTLFGIFFTWENSGLNLRQCPL